MNHPFADGNKRWTYCGTFLVLNGLERVVAGVDSSVSKSCFHLPHMNCPARSHELGQIR